MSTRDRALVRTLDRLEKVAARIPNPNRRVPADKFLLVMPRVGETIEECLARNGLTDEDVRGCAMLVFGSADDDSDVHPEMREALRSRPPEGIVS